MKKQSIILLILLLIIPSLSFGQLKIQDKPVEISEELKYNDQFSGLGFLDPARFSMSHSVSMSYLSMGGEGVAQNMYLNTMSYQIAAPLMLRVQWGIQNFPYNSFGNNSSPLFQSGFFISGAELKYKPSDKFEMKLQFSNGPGYYRNSLYRNYSPFGLNDRFFIDDDEN